MQSQDVSRQTMSRWFRGSLYRTAAVFGMAAVLVGVGPAVVFGAQKTPVPRTTDALTAIPRTKDGKPDFTGFWQVMNTANFDIEPHHARPGVPGGLGIVSDGPLPYKPEALAKRRENYEKRATEDVDASTKCFLPGVPRIMYEPHPFRITTLPEMIAMHFEHVGAARYVYMNKPHPKGPLEFWMGDSRGHWEKDVLVVDASYFNSDPWFDRSGNYHSEQMHMVERYQFLTPNHIQYEAVIEDPQVFTRPFTIKMVLYRHVEPYFETLDNECYAYNDRDIKPRPPLAVEPQ